MKKLWQKQIICRIDNDDYELLQILQIAKVWTDALIYYWFTEIKDIWYALPLTIYGLRVIISLEAICSEVIFLKGLIGNP